MIMADTLIKPEIKLDPSATTPSMTDVPDYLYEDDIDTDLHIPPAPEAGGPQAWLVKVPKYIWDAWGQIYHGAPDDGGEIEIGKMRVYHNAEGKEGEAQRTQILLTPGIYQHRELPKTYNLDIKSTGYSNTVVFSEKDLPGHLGSKGFRSRNNKSRTSLLSSSRNGIQPKSERYNSSTDTKSHLAGKYRTAIPKQTALAPQIYHVADAAPQQDKSYDTWFAKSYAKSIAPTKSVKYVPGIDHELLRQQGSANYLDSAFTLTSRPAATRKGGKMAKDKAVRMSQEALLDRLYQCFRRYRYWSLKALRNELRQPESFIKETLEGIATLIRSGDFAMQYALKPQYADLAGGSDAAVKEEIGVVESEAGEDGEPGSSDFDGDGVDGSEGDDDLDGDGEGFEDVAMEMG